MGSFAYPCYIRPVFADSVGKSCKGALTFAAAPDPNIVIAFCPGNNAFPRIFDHLRVICIVKRSYDPRLDTIAWDDDTDIFPICRALADQIRQMVYVSSDRFAVIQTRKMDRTRGTTFWSFISVQWIDRTLERTTDRGRASTVGRFFFP